MIVTVAEERNVLCPQKLQLHQQKEEFIAVPAHTI